VTTAAAAVRIFLKFVMALSLDLCRAGLLSGDEERLGEHALGRCAAAHAAAPGKFPASGKQSSGKQSSNVKQHSEVVFSRSDRLCNLPRKLVSCYYDYHPVFSGRWRVRLAYRN